MTGTRVYFWGALRMYLLLKMIPYKTFIFSWSLLSLTPLYSRSGMRRKFISIFLFMGWMRLLLGGSDMQCGQSHSTGKCMRGVARTFSISVAYYIFLIFNQENIYLAISTTRTPLKRTTGTFPHDKHNLFTQDHFYDGFLSCLFYLVARWRVWTSMPPSMISLIPKTRMEGWPVMIAGWRMIQVSGERLKLCRGRSRPRRERVAGTLPRLLHRGRVAGTVLTISQRGRVAGTLPTQRSPSRG